MGKKKNFDNDFNSWMNSQMNALSEYDGMTNLELINNIKKKTEEIDWQYKDYIFDLLTKRINELEEKAR